MATFRWIIRAIVLLLIFAFSNAQFFNPGCFDFDEYEDFFFDPKPPCDVSDPVNTTAPNTTIPVLPPLLPLLPAAPNCTTVNPPGNSTVGGNSVFLVIDPKTLQLILQAITPCNATGNSTANNSTTADNSTVGTTAIGDVPVPDGSNSGLVCDLITLIKKIVDSVLGIVRPLLKSLIDTIINLLRSILQTVLGKLLPTLVNDLGSLLTKFLTDLLDSVKALVNTALTDLLGKKSLVSNLLTQVNTLLSGVPLGLEPAALSDVTEKVGTLLNNTIIGVIEDVETLVNSLLSPTPTGLVPNVTTEITLLLNNTLQDLLKDVDALVTDLLTELLGNPSVVGNLTTDVTKLLNDVLGDTICNVEKLLNDSSSLSQLIQNLEKLIQDLLDDVLKNVDKVLVDALTKVLGKRGLLDKLLQDILKLLQDLLTNLALGSTLKSSPIATNPDAFIDSILANLTRDLNQLLTGAVPGGSDAGAVLPTINATPTTGLLPGVLGLVNGTLTDIVNTVRTLLTRLDTTLANGGNGLLSNLLKAIEELLNNLLKNLLGEVSTLLSARLSNSSSIINPSNLTGPIGPLVTNILKQVLLCKGICNNGTNPVPPIPPIPPAPPVTPVPPVPPVSPAPPTPSICWPFPVPVIVPVNQQPPEDTLFKDANDPRSFLEQLQQYQALINRNVYSGIGGNCGEDLVDGLINAAGDPFGSESSPNRLLGGIESMARLTNNVATNGLWNLVNSVSNSTSS